MKRDCPILKFLFIGSPKLSNTHSHELLAEHVRQQ